MRWITKLKDCVVLTRHLINTHNSTGISCHVLRRSIIGTTQHMTSRFSHANVPEFADTNYQQCLDLITKKDLLVINDFVTQSEEVSLLNEIEPYLARLRYEYSHWDDAIHGYRETERSIWNDDNKKIIETVKEQAFKGTEQPTGFVHVLDLETEGEIKPHKDSVRYCGDTIAGVSLLSDSVMRLARCDDSSIYIDILLKRRSLYIMRHSARYDYTHELLHNSRSFFRGEAVPKTRRVSLICRNQPTGSSS